MTRISAGARLSRTCGQRARIAEAEVMAAEGSGRVGWATGTTTPLVMAVSTVLFGHGTVARQETTCALRGS